MSGLFAVCDDWFLAFAVGSRYTTEAGCNKKSEEKISEFQKTIVCIRIFNDIICYLDRCDFSR